METMAAVLDYSRVGSPRSWKWLIHSLALTLSLPALFFLFLCLMGVLPVAKPSLIHWLLEWKLGQSLLAVCASWMLSLIIFGVLRIGRGLWTTGFCASVNSLALLVAIVAILIHLF